jgi:hypothetical protein
MLSTLKNSKRVYIHFLSTKGIPYPAEGIYTSITLGLSSPIGGKKIFNLSAVTGAGISKTILKMYSSN